MARRVKRDSRFGEPGDGRAKLINLWLSKARYAPNSAARGGDAPVDASPESVRAAITRYLTHRLLRSESVPVGECVVNDEPGNPETELRVTFPELSKLKAAELADWKLAWTEAPSNVEYKAWTAFDSDANQSGEDVYIVGADGATYFVRGDLDHVESAIAIPVRPLEGRSLYLDFYDGEGMEQVWCWKDLDSDEASQEFESEEDAVKAMEDGELEWSRLDD